MLGVLLINKPLGFTSHDVVNKVRRALNTKRVGHAGTLDPLATGLLLVAVGPATRFLQYLPLEPKEYVGWFKFGASTPTQDSESEPDEVREVPGDLEQRLLDAGEDFVGEVTQIPPMYSAVKKDGRPLYDYARKGLEVERESRTVFIEELTILERDGDRVKFKVVCSGGTYVRTLAHDLGQAVGCGAHLASLERTRVGKFSLDQAIGLDEVSIESLIPLAAALPPLPLVQLDASECRYVWEGRRVNRNTIGDARHVGLLDPDGRVIGIARPEPGGLAPECVIPAEALVAST